MTDSGSISIRRGRRMDVDPVSDAVVVLPGSSSNLLKNDRDVRMSYVTTDTFFNPNDPSFWLHFGSIPVPSDGLCFIHACSASLSFQHLQSLSKSYLLDILRIECDVNRSTYLDYFTDNQRPWFDHYMHAYVRNGIYNTPFGDIVPNIMAQALNFELVIIEKRIGNYLTSAVPPHDTGTPLGKLLLLKTNKHYDAIKPVLGSNPPGLIQKNSNKGHFGDHIATPHSRDCNDRPQNDSFSHYKTNSHQDSSPKRRVSLSVHNAFTSQVKRDVGLRISHLNIRSLYNKLDEIRYIVIESDIDILCMSETWLDDSIQNSELHIPGYVIERHDRNRTGGGVIIYIKDSIIYKLRNDIATTSNIVENLWIEIVSSKHAKSHLISCMYRPPSARIDYYNGILDILEKATSEDMEISLFGDLNYNYVFDESLSSNPIHYLESLYGLNQLIREPTRVTKTTSTLLDVVLATSGDSHVSNKVFKFTISDHYMIYTCIKDIIKSNTHRTIKFRSYKSFNVDDFLYEMSANPTFKEIKNGSIKCVESAWSLWKDGFTETCNSHAPLRTMRVKNRHNPWITPDIVKLMYERDFTHRKAKEKVNDDKLWNDYRRIRNLVTANIVRSKKEYFENVTPKIKTDSKQTWKELRRVMGNKKNNNHVPCQLNNDKLNLFFSTIGSKIKKDLPDPGQLKWNNPECIYSFEFVQIDHTCVLNHLRKLSGDSHLDVLNMDTRLLRLCANIIAPSLTYIMNLSLETGVIPDDWKIARVTPIYKGKGSKQDETNYRPISILASISIIMEREVSKQVMSYLIVHDLISVDQFAFLKNHSTVTSLHRLIDDWYEAINENEYIMACFIDVQKCFDSINHNILLEKLAHYGFTKSSNKWFSNYLFKRKQFVASNGKSSNNMNVSTGVPQGSALGPLLFLIFINDFPQNIRNSSSNMFADDCCVYISGRSFETTKTKFKESVNDASDWYTYNNLPVNTNKSFCIHQLYLVAHPPQTAL